MVRRLESFLYAWTSSELIGPEEMGHTAPKVESLDAALLRLIAFAQTADIAGTSDYLNVVGSSGDDGGSVRDAGTVVGMSDAPPFSTFKKVEPKRLKFVGEPTFDPVPYLDAESAQVFTPSIAVF